MLYCCAVLLLLCPLTGAADVIVLKSGRRIQAASVVERDGKVFYETETGTIGIPARLVERIERGAYVPQGRMGKGGGEPKAVSRALESGLDRLTPAGSEDIVEGGEVRHDRISQLESRAKQSGDPDDRALAAGAHVVAARHYVGAGDWTRAKRHLLQALVYETNHPVLLLQVAALEHNAGEYEMALQRLLPVLNDPDWGAEAYRLQGILFYRQDRMDRAVEAWRKALELRPDPQLERQLAELEVESDASAGYEARSTSRFVLRYNREVQSQPRLEQEIISALEQEYDSVSRDFQYFPREPIVVLLYTDQAFRDVTGAPDFYAGIFDGKVRIPVQGLTSLPPRLRTTLRHELIHAVIHLKTRGRTPRWLHEGLAQWHSGQSRRAPPALLRELFAAGDGSGLARLERGFQGDANQVFAAYAVAWFVVDVLERRYGIAGRHRLLDSLGSAGTVEGALRGAHGLTPDRFDELIAEEVR